MGDKAGKPGQVLQAAGEGNPAVGRGLSQKGQSDDILASPAPPPSGLQQQGAWVARHGHGGPQAARERDTWERADDWTSSRTGRQVGQVQPANQKGGDGAGWLMSDGRGVSRDATEKGRGLPTRARGIIYPASLADRIEALGAARWPAAGVLHGQATEAAELVAAFLTLQAANGRGRPVEVRDGRWSTAGFAHLSDSARSKGFTERLHLPRLADRVDALQVRPWPPPAVLHGSALDAVDLVEAAGPEAVVLLDPPYHRDGDEDRDRTGYGWDLPLEQTLGIAARLADAGVLVEITEGGPLARDLGPGWYSYDLTEASSGVVHGREWLTINRPVSLGLARQSALGFEKSA